MPLLRLLIIFRVAVTTTPTLPELGICEATPTGFHFRLQPPLRTALGAGSPPTYPQSAQGVTDMQSFAFTGCFELPALAQADFVDMEPSQCFTACSGLQTTAITTTATRSSGVVQVSSAKPSIYAGLSGRLCYCMQTKSTLVPKPITSCSNSCTFTDPPVYKIYTSSTRFCGGPSAISLYENIVSVSAMSTPQLDHIRQLMWQVGVLSNSSLVLHANAYSNGFPMFMYDYVLKQKVENLQVDYLSSYLVAKRMGASPDLYVFKIDTRSKSDVRVTLQSTLQPSWGECSNLVSLDAGGALDPLNKVYYRFANNVLYGVQYTTSTLCIKLKFSETIVAVTANADSGDLVVQLFRSSVTDKGTYLMNLGKMESDPVSGICSFTPTVSFTAAAGPNYKAVMACSDPPLLDDNDRLDSLSIVSASAANAVKSKYFMVNNVNTDPLRNRACFAWANDRSNARWQLSCASSDRGLEASYQLWSAPAMMTVLLTDPGVPRQAPRPFIVSSRWDVSGMTVRVSFNQATLRGATLVDTDGDFLPDLIDSRTQCPVSGDIDPDPAACPCAWVLDDWTIATYAARLVYCAFRSASLLELKLLYPVNAVASETSGLKLVLRKDAVYSYIGGLYSQAAVSESVISTPVCDPATMYPKIAGSPLPARGFAIQQDLCSGSVLDYCSSGNTGGVRNFVWSIKDYGGIGFMYQTKLDAIISAANADTGVNDGTGEFRRGACQIELPVDAIEPGKQVRINVQLAGRWCSNLVSSMDVAIMKQGVPSPVVKIVAPSTIVRSEQIILQANVTATSCSSILQGSSSSLKYEWSMTPYLDITTGSKGDPSVLVPLFTTRADSSELTFKADALTPGSSYLVGVKVGYSAAWPNGATTAYIDVTVPRSSITCSCTVASQSIADLAVLDCRKSIDRDFPALPPIGFTWSMDCSRKDDLPCLPRINSTSSALLAPIPVCTYDRSSTTVEIGGLNYQTPAFSTNRDRLGTYLCQGATTKDYGLVFMNGGSTWGEAEYRALISGSSFGRSCQTTVVFNRTSPTAPAPVRPNLQVQVSGPRTQPLVRNIYGTALCVNCLLPVLPGLPNRVESACVWDVSIETLAADWISYEFGVIRRESNEASRSLTFHAPGNTLPPDTQFRFKACCTPASLLDPAGPTQAGLSSSCGYAEFATAPGAPQISAVTVTPPAGQANACRRARWKATSTAVLSCKGFARVDVGSGPQDIPFTNGGVTEDSLEICYFPVATSTQVCVSCCDNFDSCSSACTPISVDKPTTRSGFWDKINQEIVIAGSGSPYAGYLTAVVSSWGPPPIDTPTSEATTSFVSEVANNFFASVNSQDPSQMGPSEVRRASSMVSTLAVALGVNPETVSSTAVANVLALGSASASSLKNQVLSKRASSASSGAADPLSGEILDAIDASLRSFGSALTLNTQLKEAATSQGRRLTQDEASIELTEQVSKGEIEAEEAATEAERRRRKAEVSKLMAKISGVKDPVERAVLLENLLSQLSADEADWVDKLYAQSLLANGFADLMADVSGTLSTILTTSDDSKTFSFGSGSLVVGRTSFVADPNAALSIDPLSAAPYSEAGYAIASYSMDPWAHLPESPPGAFLLQSSRLYDSEGDALSFHAADRAHVFFADKLTYASGSCYWLDTTGSSSLGTWRTGGLVNSGTGCLGDSVRADAGLVAVFIDLAEPTRVFVTTDYYQDSKSVWILFSAVTISVLVVTGCTLLIAFYAAVGKDKKEQKQPPTVRVPIGDGVSDRRSLSDPIFYESNNWLVRVCYTFLNILKRDHLLIAPFFPDPTLRLRRANRLAALVCAIAGCFVGPAILYGAAPGSDFAAELHAVEAALLTALLVFPLAKLALLLFVSKPEQALYPDGNLSPSIKAPRMRSGQISPLPPSPKGLPPVLSSALRVPTRAYQTDKPSETVASLPVLPAPAPPTALPSANRGQPETPRQPLPPAVVDVDVDTKDLLNRVRRQYVNELLAKSDAANSEGALGSPGGTVRVMKMSDSPVSYIAQALAYAACAVFVASSIAITTVYVRNFNQALATDWVVASVVACALLLLPFELLKTTVLLLVELRKLELRRRLLEDKIGDKREIKRGPAKLIKPPKIRPPLFENIPRPPPTPPPVMRGGLSYLDLPPTPRVRDF